MSAIFVKLVEELFANVKNQNKISKRNYNEDSVKLHKHSM